MTATRTFTWDGFDAAALAKRLGLPSVHVHAEVESTQDIAHALAEGFAPSGTIVIADSQRSGRGRHGRAWSSQPGQGVWCTMIERPRDVTALDVLSIRIALRLAESLDGLAGQRVGLKWPNDLVVAMDRPGENQTTPPRLAKLAGILLEARWYGSRFDWVAIGVGVNVARPSGVEAAAGLLPDVARIDVLAPVVSAVREAARAKGLLTEREYEQYEKRDVLAGRRVVSPSVGTVFGIDTSGALGILDDGILTQHRSGTIVFAEDA